MFHYEIFVSHQATFGFMGEMGWVGVDLFFVLSGYLIGNQIFSTVVRQQKFSFKNFYYRRLLRTLPAYLFVLSIYFLIPGFGENTNLPPLWKFLTFTQNFDLHAGTAFSHAWSLCVEEQFYLVLPILALMMIKKESMYRSWLAILGLIVMGMILRGSLWVYCQQHANQHFRSLYYTKIYYATFCRLDELVLGVAIAILKNFHKELWLKITRRGNWLLVTGMIGSSLSCYLFLQHHYSLFVTISGYPLLGISFAALTLAALSPNACLNKIRIPGVAALAIWSYAIYLVHKPVSVIVYRELSSYGIAANNWNGIVIVSLASILCGWLLYCCVEKPFLTFRDKIGVINHNTQAVSAIRPDCSKPLC